MLLPWSSGLVCTTVNKKCDPCELSDMAIWRGYSIQRSEHVLTYVIHIYISPLVVLYVIVCILHFKWTRVQRQILGTLCLYTIAVTGSNNWKQEAVQAVEVTTAGSTYVKNLLLWSDQWRVTNGQPHLCLRPGKVFKHI
jgi:Ca2+/Na+ antiporter